MGLDPRDVISEFIQDFLEELLIDCLNGVSENDVIEKIREYKKYFRTLDPWKKGMSQTCKQYDNVFPRVLKQAKVPREL